MNLKEAILNADYSKPITFDPETILATAFGVYLDLQEYRPQLRLKVYWLESWYDTDIWVGVKAYELDRELVCISRRKGRKYPEEFTFVDFIRKQDLFDYLLSLVSPLNIDEDEAWLDWNQEV